MSVLTITWQEFDELKARAEKAEAELNDFRSVNNQLVTNAALYIADRERLKADNERLRLVLTKIRDTYEAYEPWSGEQARAALAASEGKETI